MEAIRHIIAEIKETLSEDEQRKLITSLGGHDIDEKSMIRTFWAHLYADACAEHVVQQASLTDAIDEWYVRHIDDKPLVQREGSCLNWDH